MSKRVRIVEVGARDGLQNEKQVLSRSVKIDLIKRLSKTGLKNIEVGAFVSPKWVPQMAGSKEIVNSILKSQSSGNLSKDICYTALVPNAKGMSRALETNLNEVAFFTAASEAFTKKNINCTINESFERLKEMQKLGHGRGLKYRGYVSTAFYCPYLGKVKPSQVTKVVKRLFEMGCYEVSIGDTIGAATPKEVSKLLSLLLKSIPAKKLAMHFHDTRGTAMSNIYESLIHGIRVFDSSIGGVGGCPYAPGAAGNVATEDVAYFLQSEGYKSNVDLKKLNSTANWLRTKLDRPIPGKVSQAGLPKY